MASLILAGGRRGERRSGFVEVPLRLRHPSALAALAALAVIVTATPGTAWLEHDEATGVLLLHVLDLVDEAEWRADPGPLREAPHGDLRVSGTVLTLALGFAQLALAACLAGLRAIGGPRAQDRVLGLDALYVTAMLLFLVTGMRAGSPFFFEAAMVIGVMGFVSTVALARFLLRGEVIE